MIKVALFDLDGVVIKDPIFSTVYAAEFGIKPEDMLPFFTNEFQQCLIGEKDLKEAVLPYLNSWKWSRTADELLEYWFTHHQDIDTNVVQLVDNLRSRGIATGITTNQEKYRTDHIWNTCGLKNHFDHLFVSCELQNRKPQTTFFSKMLQALEPVAADEILFIDDMMNNIAAAGQLGFKTHYYTNFDNLNTFIKTAV